VDLSPGGSVICTFTNRITAQFVVNKDFVPDSGAQVVVSLSCTSGSVVNDDTSASEADPANFTVMGFSAGTTCTASEAVPAGYTLDESDCLNVDLVSDGVCTITNTLRTAEFVVNKDFIPNSPAGVSVSLTCSDGTVVTTPLQASEGSPAVFTVTGYSGDPTCTATEAVPAGYTSDESDCLNVHLTSDGVCTIVNTFVPTVTPIPTPTPVTPVVLPTVVPPTPTVAPPTPAPTPTLTPVVLPTVAPPTPTVAPPSPTVVPPKATPAVLPSTGGSGATPLTTVWWPALVLLAGGMALMLAGLGSAVWALTRRSR
jgi:hypothetical protein